MLSPDFLLALLLAAAPATPVQPSATAPAPIATPTPIDPATLPLPPQVGDAPEEAVQREILALSYRYFAARDGGRYDEAYALIAPSMRAYLSAPFYRSQVEPFNQGAGAVSGRLVTRLSWYRDPPDAPAPGLYVAADFVSRFANLYLHCGYLMWHRAPAGEWRIVREEQSFVDTRTADQMTPENRNPLPRQMGCVQP